MAKIRLALGAFVIIALAATSLFPASAEAEKKLYVGGTQSLTGPFAEDSAAVLAAIEDYVKYVNETKNLAPWRKEKFPVDITLEVMWRDDELKPAKALSIYEELKAKGMLVARISGSPIALAQKRQIMGGPHGRHEHDHRILPPDTASKHFYLLPDLYRFLCCCRRLV